MADEIQVMREKIVEMGKLMFDRHLTDLAGGNLGVRMGDKMLMTPRYAGTKFHWNLRTDQIILLDLQGIKLDGDGEISRESKVHIDLLNEFYPKITAVVHAHSRNVLVFCAAEKVMEPVIYATNKFGHIKQTRDAASGTQDLADYVVEAIKAEKATIDAKGTAACMMPRHGLITVGKDLDVAMDSAERIDTNAYILVNVGTIGGATSLVEAAIPENPEYE